MTRVAVFAGFNVDNKIEDYVVYYLSELKKVVDNIVYVADCDISDIELEKINKIVDKCIAKRHGEYDFGSYKRGYIYLKEQGLINSADELLLVNDSCFGPLYEFEKVWQEMSTKDCDFWGTNLNDIDVYPHIQSFFYVFKSQIFKTELFDNFMLSITKEEDKTLIVEKYEIGFTKLLAEKGFKYSALIQTPIERNITGSLIFSQKINPLIKVCTIKDTNIFLLKILFNKLFEKFDIKYDLNLILDFAKKYNKPKLSNAIKAIRKILFRIQFNKRTFYILGHKFNY